MGYGYSAGPEDMATGNPFYNPMSPTPDWASGIAAFYQNLQQAKDRKRAQQLQDEEMRWQKYLQEQDMKWKEQERADKLAEKEKKDRDERGKRFRENIEYAAANAPLPKLRQSQVAKYHGYDPAEFSSLPASRQRELEDEMTSGKRDIEGRRITADGRKGPNYQWEDEATQLGVLLKNKLGELDDNITRYKTLAEKAEEEYRTASMGKSESMRNRAALLRKSADASKRYVWMLESHQKKLRSYQTSLKPGSPVDQSVSSSINSDYPKTISDIINGGQDIEFDVGGGNTGEVKEIEGTTYYKWKSDGLWHSNPEPTQTKK